MDTAICGRCKLELPSNCFGKNKSRDNGLQNYRKVCISTYNKVYRSTEHIKRSSISPSGFRICISCETELPIDKFANAGNGGDGKRYICRECKNSKARRGRASKRLLSPGDSKRRNYRGRVAREKKDCDACGRNLPISSFIILRSGMSPICRDCRRVARLSSGKQSNGTYKLYESMYEKQGGICRICGATQSENLGNRFAIDHDHITGRIRGLLCFRCNVGIGFLRDDVFIMQKAIEYLLENKESV